MAVARVKLFFDEFVPATARHEMEDEERERKREAIRARIQAMKADKGETTAGERAGVSQQQTSAEGVAKSSRAEEEEEKERKR